MFPFWNRQDAARLADLEARVAAADAQLAALADSERRARLELVEVSEKVYRWMKRAEAAARRGAPDAAPESPAVPVIPAETPLRLPRRQRVLWGARARIEQRRHNGHAPELPLETDDDAAPEGES